MWHQLSILYLQFHPIRQLLKLGVCQPIRFRLVAQRNLERFRHAFHGCGLHEHPFAIGCEKLEVGGYRPFSYTHFREETAECSEAMFHFTRTIQEFVQGICKSLMVRWVLNGVSELGLLDPKNKVSAPQTVLSNS